MPESLADWVTEQAERRPDAVAVVGSGTSLTYGEVAVRSDRLALTLREAGCAVGDRVCLLSPKTPDAIVALLGIYKAGAIYVPLDPSSPKARLEKILDACGSRWILAGGPVTRPLGELLAGRPPGERPAVGWLETDPPGDTSVVPRFTARDLSPAAPSPQPGRTRHHAAHILFTSGSTGTPKGVVITHDNVIRFVEWAVAHFGLGPSDRISCHPPLHFDLSMFDIFGAFAAGARLHLVPSRLAMMPRELAAFIRASELTQWFSVPSVLTYLAKFDAVRAGDFPRLRRLLWCGEVLPTPVLRHWMNRLPHATFTNLYGPTETTIASSHYTLPICPAHDRQSIPIGAPCGGEELLILGPSLRPVPDGEVGDLYIGGVGLSPGYWNDRDRTRAAFLPRPGSADPSERIYRTGDLARRGDDGLVYFVGRTDTQIKSRGYRIELGEVESALGTLPALRECAVVAIPTDGFEGNLICCAYAPAAGADVTPAALRERLGRLLPPHMIPARWLALDRLPINVNGKIDRVSLKDTFARHAAAASGHV